MKNDNISIDKAVEFANQGNILLKRRENGMLLSDYQLSILNLNGFNYMNYTNYNDLLFDIEDYLFDNYDDELDFISSQIAELLYYKDTKK